MSEMCYESTSVIHNRVRSSDGHNIFLKRFGLAIGEQPERISQHKGKKRGGGEGSGYPIYYYAGVGPESNSPQPQSV